MPKASKYPKLRVSVKRGKAGQVWTSYWYDMRGTGKPDVKLGADREAALRHWAEIALDAPRIAGTLEEAFRAWEQADDGLKRYTVASTRADWIKALRAIRTPLGGARWEDVTLPGLREYLRQRTAKARGRKEMQLLSVIWTWARMEGLTALPFPGADLKGSKWKGEPGKRQIEVSDEAFAALHKHADQTLRDALDIATATGLRVIEVLALRLSDVRGGELVSTASKTGKTGEFDLSASRVLQPIIDRRKALKVPHLFLLASPRKAPVTHRALADRFTKARAAAAKECPECAGLHLADMRKRASQLADDLQGASKLLQHSSLAVTRAHYRQGDKLKPVR